MTRYQLQMRNEAGQWIADGFGHGNTDEDLTYDSRDEAQVALEDWCRVVRERELSDDDDDVRVAEIETQTTAEQISDILDGDGLHFTAKDGRHLDEIAESLGGRRTARVGDVQKWTFRDGSTITICGNAWDLGYPNCNCWQGAGHRDNCEARPETVLASDLFGLQIIDSVGDQTQVSDGDTRYWIATAALDEEIERPADDQATSRAYEDWCNQWGTSDEPATLTTRYHGAPYGYGGEAGDPVETLADAERLAKRTLHAGQRLSVYEDGEEIARFVAGEDGVEQVELG